MGNVGIYFSTLLLGFLALGTYGVTHRKYYMGCYADRDPRAFPDYYQTPGQTIKGCFKKAVELGYEMFAIQNGGECWLDDSKQNNYDKYGKSEYCYGMAGGYLSNSVFRITSFCTRRTKKGVCCVFPFIYKGYKYSSCTYYKKNKHGWCATTSNYDKDGDWGICVDPCEKGWHARYSHCYKVISDRKRSWNDARLKCKSLGADLVIIHSRYENEFVGKLLPSWTNAWIGYRRKDDGKFYWVDGSKPWYTRWAYNEPNSVGSAEGCTEMQNSLYIWNDLSCREKKIAVCEKGL